ncbi:hypothetical protein LMG19282_02239 [Cupriavidus campinensis]|uniref:hypothetical protein n=1 Tax=Cupriavidus campinensis TaxID=151783 RepID=UPI001B181776|nr:hypothetical protein [Cupriavidus campinensis]CAG2142536.1 hypothetical protein LMG19282_02239 [Cupriavidus campinensis]
MTPFSMHSNPNYRADMSKKYTALSIAITALLIVTIWTAFAPGFMSNDSVSQYRSALAQSYADNHPAIMSYVWHLSLSLIHGPESLLVLHLVLLVLGIFVWQMDMPSPRWKVLVPAIFFLPWILNFAGVLWKDVGMAFSLLVATGLLFNQRRSIRLALLSLPFLFYAFAVRHNAILATAPLIFVASLGYLHKRKVIYAALIAIVASVAFWLIGSLVSYGLLKAERRHLETFLMGDDIAMISAQTGQNLLPWVKHDDLMACTKPRILYERALCFISRGYDPGGSLVTEVPVETTHKLWKETVLAHPILSAKIRWDAFLYFLRSPQLAPAYVWQPQIMQNDLGIALARPDSAQRLETYVTLSQNSVLSEFFKPYLWLTLAVIMLVLCARMRPSIERTQVFALNLSALGCYASLLAAVPSVDFRYAYWCIIATNLSFIVFLAAAWRGRRSLVHA